MQTFDALQPLSEQSLTYRRSERWRGDSSQVPLSAFSNKDRRAIESIYRRLRKLQSSFEEVGYQSAEGVSVFRAFVEADEWRKLIQEARSITDPPQSSEVDRRLFAQVKHDIRGGALSQLVGICQLAKIRPLEEQEVAKSYLRVRDHTKIMRNGVPELDPEVYARDQQERMHDVDLIVEKWKNASLASDDQSVEMQVHCDFSGPISDRCVEFSALDRVLYNLMNNATKYTAEGKVELYITRAVESDHLILAILNAVGQEQTQRLREEFGGDDLQQLFAGGFTTGGHGVGLSICAEFVGFAFGVTPQQAREEGYVGARLADQTFMAWVHWPIVDEGNG